MVRKKVNPPWFDWNSRWSPSTIDLPVTDAPHSIHWIVPDNVYLHMVGFHVLMPGAQGIGATNVRFTIQRGEIILFLHNITSPVSSTSDTHFVYLTNIDPRGAKFNNVWYRNYRLSDHIYLRPGDFLDWHLINALGGQTLETAHIITRSFKA